MECKRKTLCFLIVSSLILTLLINLKSASSTTWSLLLLPLIFFIIVRPRWLEGVLLFFAFGVIKYSFEFYLNKMAIPRDILYRHLINTGVNFVVFITVCYFIIQNHKLTQQLQKASVKDPLTSAYNRRFMQVFYDGLSLDNTHMFLLFDLDYFKQVNDTHGHQYGDLTLKRFVRAVEEVVKESGMIIRVGGEEFAVILPDMTVNEGYLIAERIREKFEKTVAPFKGQRITTTTSAGITEFNKKQMDLKTIMDRADQALYQAKKSGRNKVTIYNLDATQVIG